MSIAHYNDTRGRDFMEAVVVTVSGAAVVSAAPFDVEAALDLDERVAFDVREICAPFALRVKEELTLQFRPAKAAPVEGEFRLEAGWRFLVSEAEAHVARRMSRPAKFW